MTDPLSPLSIAAQQQAGTPYYGLVWLALASIAYTDEGSGVIRDVTADLPTAIAALPDPPAPPGHPQPAVGTWGRWQMDWGPVANADNSNLMYAASYREIGSGLPVFAIVGIRGTDTEDKGWRVAGLLAELYEDIDVGHKVPWSSVADDPRNPCTGSGSAEDVAIAKGTCEGLKTLRRMTATAPDAAAGQDVETHVRRLATTFGGVPIIVTGHSLGGCLTTVMAAWLGDMLAAAGIDAAIVPHAFAPPTAGTPGFAAKFAAQFPAAHLWWNTLDVVPNAFQNIANAAPDTPSMTHMTGFWQDHGGPKIGEVEKLAVEGFLRLEHAYAQPAANLITLAGSVVVPAAAAGKDDWSTQLLIQHLPPQYHYLISTQLADTVASYPLPSYPEAARSS
jgi:hypothetical protein